MRTRSVHHRIGIPVRVLAAWMLVGLSGSAAAGVASVASPAVAQAAQRSDAAYAALWNVPVGEALPLLSAPDADGTRRTLADLSGSQGLLLVVTRSADW